MVGGVEEGLGDFGRTHFGVKNADTFPLCWDASASRLWTRLSRSADSSTAGNGFMNPVSPRVSCALGRRASQGASRLSEIFTLPVGRPIRLSGNPTPSSGRPAKPCWEQAPHARHPVPGSPTEVRPDFPRAALWRSGQPPWRTKDRVGAAVGASDRFPRVPPDGQPRAARALGGWHSGGPRAV